MNTYLSKHVYAEITQQTSKNQAHIKTVNYDPNQIYRINGMQGFTTAIQFSTEEKILSVNVGDSSAWLVNVSGHIINLKPVSGSPDTNMNVVTTRGAYLFFLTAPPLKLDQSGKVPHTPTTDTVFLLRFLYPQDKVQTAPLPFQNSSSIMNTRYSVRGSRAIAPVSVYDDSHFTYFDFGKNKNIPAIFIVDGKRNEAVVNYHIENHLVVVETVGVQFTLRNGNQVATVFNEATL